MEERKAFRDNLISEDIFDGNFIRLEQEGIVPADTEHHINFAKNKFIPALRLILENAPSDFAGHLKCARAFKENCCVSTGLKKAIATVDQLLQAIEAHDTAKARDVLEKLNGDYTTAQTSVEEYMRLLRLEERGASNAGCSIVGHPQI